MDKKSQFLSFAGGGDLTSLHASSKIENGEREALINALSRDRGTISHSASALAHGSILRWLLFDSGGRAAGFNRIFAEIQRRETHSRETALHLACQEGFLEFVQALVEGSKIENGEREALLNTVDYNGETVLHVASSHGRAKIIRWLVSDSGGRAAGFKSLLAKSWSGATALHLACQEGHLECAQALVEGSTVDNGERQALLNVVDRRRWTALHRASAKGHTSVVRWLLSDSGGRAAGFKSLLAKTRTGATAFHLACQEGHLECAQALVEGSKIDNGEREALINATTNDGFARLHFASFVFPASIIGWLPSDSGGRTAVFKGALAGNNGHTALHYASRHGHSSIIEWLLSDSGGRAADFQSLLAKTRQGETALHVACHRGHLECVQALVEGSKIENGEREALINAVSTNKWTALMYGSVHGHASIVQWLLSDTGGRAALNSLLSKTDAGATALHLACQYGHLECVEALVEGSKIDNGEREALINAIDNLGSTALCVASYYGHALIVELLLCKPLPRLQSLLARSLDGSSALHAACKEGHLECVKALLEGRKIDNNERESLISAVDGDGWTILHFAVLFGQRVVIGYLLSDSGGRAAGLKSSTITKRNDGSESALHLAVRCGHIEVLSSLLIGCSSTERINLFLIIDDHGWTALHHAARYRQPESIRELLHHHPETQLIINARDHRGMTALHRAVIGSIDEESSDEWVDSIYEDDGDTKEAVIAALLYPGLSFDEIQRFMDEEDGNEEKKETRRQLIQAAVSKIDPNQALKFD